MPKPKELSKRETIDQINRSNPQIVATIAAVRMNEEQRAATSDPEEEYRFEVSVSSETPVYRWGELEILSHDPGDIRLEWIQSGNAPLLWMHDTREHIGIVEDFSIEGGRGTAVVRFGKSKLAQEKRDDVINGILVNVSIGYRVWGYELVEKEDGQPPVYRVTDWEPKEISPVTVPADTAIGFNRSDDSPEKKPHRTQSEERTMDKHLVELRIKYGMREGATEAEILKEHAKRNAEEGERKAEEKARAELTRREGIEEIAREAGMDDAMTRKAIDDNQPVEEFRKDVMKELLDKREDIPASPQRRARMTSKEDQEMQSFSVGRFLLGALDGRLDGIEANVMQRGQAEANDIGLGVGTAYLPMSAMRELAMRDVMYRYNQTRAQVVSSDSAGGFLVGTENISLIRALRDRLWMSKLGVKELPGLRNNVTIPGITEEGDAEDLTEGQAMNGTDVLFNQRSLSPNRVGTTVTFDLLLLRQGTPEVEMMLTDILFSRLAQKFNRMGLEFLRGLVGAGEVVTGGAALNRALLRQFKTLIAAENADEVPPSYLFNANIEGVLDNIKVDAGSGKFLYEAKENGEGRVLARRAFTTNQMADTDIFHLDATKVWRGSWGGIDFVRDNITRAKQGELVLTANAYIDFAIEHPEYLARCTDINLANQPTG